MVTTSSLVVELVVIGVGAVLWIVLLVAALFGSSWLQIEDGNIAYPIHIFGTSMLCFLGLTSWCAWRNLTNTQYLQVREQSRFLNGESTDNLTEGQDQWDGWRRFRKVA